MNTANIIASAGALALLAGCVTVPTGPAVMVLPGSGKSFEQFRADDLDCRQFAYYPPYVVQQQPQVYVEQPQAQPSQPSGYWYYCSDSRAYYPYVKECASGWQRVAPQPQN